METIGVYHAFISTLVIFIAVFIKPALGLMCYRCLSTQAPSCGVHFDSFSFRPQRCKPGQTCGLQRQQPDRSSGQVGAVLRDCYTPGMVIGLNSSNGCRWYMNPSEPGYKAFYCFCDTDACNIASPTAFTGGYDIILQLVSLLLLLLLR